MDERLSQFGFALLESQDAKHYICKYEVTLGRVSKNSTLDITLGDNMNISRRHAVIHYNFADRCFELRAVGKNGVIVGGQTVTPKDPSCPLVNGDDIAIGDYSFKFWLAKDPSEYFAQLAAPQPAAPQLGAQPPGAVRPGAPQLGALPPGAPQLGALPPGAPQLGALPPGAPQLGALPPGALQAGLLQAGGLQAGGLQAGAFQPGAFPPGALGAVVAAGPPAGPPVAAAPMHMMVNPQQAYAVPPGAHPGALAQQALAQHQADAAAQWQVMQMQAQQQAQQQQQAALQAQQALAQAVAAAAGGAWAPPGGPPAHAQGGQAQGGQAPQ